MNPPGLVRVVCPVCQHTAWWDDRPRFCNNDGTRR